MAVVLVPLPSPSQTLPFEVIGLNEGLPQSQVNTVVQDAQGYIWVGTWGGLARYDGERFATFATDSGLPSSRIQELLVSRSGDLWIATANGLALWSGNRVTPVADPPVASVRCRAVAEDADGAIWVGTERGVAFRKGEPFQPLPLPGLGEAPKVYGMVPSGKGALAVTTGGLFYCDSSGRAEPVAGPPQPPPSFRTALFCQGKLWLGTEGHGLWVREAAGWAPAKLGDDAGTFIYRLSSDREGTLFVCTHDAGLYIKGPEEDGFRHWSLANGLPSSVLNCAFEDREGSLWIGTEIGGLARLGTLSVTNFGRAQGLPDACVFGVTETPTPGRIWVGTLHGAALLEADPVARVLETVALRDGLENDWIWKAVQDPSGALWLLTDQALHVRPPGSKRVGPTPEGALFPKGLILDMAMDSSGRIWITGDDPVRGGLRMADGKGSFKSWLAAEGGSPLLVCRRVTPRRAGGVWLCAEDQKLAWCDGSVVRELPGEPPLPGKGPLSALFEDSVGRLWAGNDSGLASRGTDGRWTLLNDRPGFTSRHVFSIGEDRRGVVWVGTGRGVFRFFPDGAVMAMTPEDGLASYESNQQGFYCDAAGGVWIGTVGGLSRYRAELQKANTMAPSLVVEAAEYGKTRLEFPRGLTLRWRERSVTFRIALLSFRDHGRCGYRARMEGLEAEWLPVRSATELRYTNLPPGSHRLLLQAVNESGVWGKTVAIPIRVRPPFWMTAWFRISALLCVALLALGAHRWRTMVLRRRNLELESLVAARTKELVSANSQLDYLASHDALTGLLNRRATLERFEEALTAGTGRRKVGCILVDLDGFKGVNDTLGHATGDDVLKEVSRLLRGSLRDGDSLGRLGGDEFLAVLPGADREALEAVAARIVRFEVRPRGEGTAPVVTTSCGCVTGTGKAGGSAAALLAAADELLYEVKRAGKKGFRLKVMEEKA